MPPSWVRNQIVKLCINDPAELGLLAWEYTTSNMLQWTNKSLKQGLYLSVDD